MNKKVDDDRPYVMKSCKQRENGTASQKIRNGIQSVKAVPKMGFQWLLIICLFFL